jgi:hypothetical protein
MTNLESQLASIFKKGLAADPKAAQSLVASLSKHSMAAEQGYTKSEANYHTSYDSGKECGTCQHMTGDTQCEVVSGSISADGVCDFYTADPSKQDNQPSDSGSSDGSGSNGSSSDSQSVGPN